MRKKILLFTITVLFSVGSFSQTGDFDPDIGVSLKASTNGIGGDIYYRPMKKLAVKAGVEYFSLTITSDKVESWIDEDINISIPNPLGNDLVFDTKGRFKTGALSLAVGYQPFKLFYVTAGISKSLFAPDVSGTAANDIVFEDNNNSEVARIAKDIVGPFKINIKPKSSIMPYLGVGLGNFVPQNKTVSFAFEIGAYYVGSYVLEPVFPTGLNVENIQYSGSITPEQKGRIATEVVKFETDIKTEVNTVIKDVNDALESFKFYPVIKLTVGFKAFTFKK